MQVVQFKPVQKSVRTVFDLEQAYSAINDILDGKGGHFTELLFNAAQALIVSLRRKEELRRELLSLIAQVLMFSDDSLNISRVAKLLRGYRQIEPLFVEELYKALVDNFPENIEPMLMIIGEKLKPYGFSLSVKGHKLLMDDFLNLPYPMKDSSRPYIETVWMEVTSQCNQKCTFCPDPGREGERESMSLESFKRKAFELNLSFDIGYWQLNAYGEPLLNPRIYDMIDFVKKELKSNSPIYFTSHGLTLTRPRIDKILKSLPDEIMISFHNDSQDSYALSRSEKIGDFDLLKSRVIDLCSSLILGSHPCSVRLSVLVNNSHADKRLNSRILAAFAADSSRLFEFARSFQCELANATQGASVELIELDPVKIKQVFDNASHGPDHQIPIAVWNTTEGPKTIFFSPRPVGTYANLLPYQEDPTSIEFFEASSSGCGFTNKPSLTIFANGKLGLCCLDLETTASFGEADRHLSLMESLRSKECHQIFANLAFGVADSQGCAICLGSVKK